MIHILDLSVEGGKSQELVDTSVLKQKHFNLPSDRCMKLQEFGTWLIIAMIAASDQDTATSVAIYGFMSGLLHLFSNALVEASHAKSPAQQKERAWSVFHRLRYTSILEMWQDLLLELNIEDSNPLLLQTVTLKIFKAELKEWFPSKPPQYTIISMQKLQRMKRM